MQPHTETQAESRLEFRNATRARSHMRRIRNGRVAVSAQWLIWEAATVSVYVSTNTSDLVTCRCRVYRVLCTVCAARCTCAWCCMCAVRTVCQAPRHAAVFCIARRGAAGSSVRPCVSCARARRLARRPHPPLPRCACARRWAAGRWTAGRVKAGCWQRAVRVLFVVCMFFSTITLLLVYYLAVMRSAQHSGIYHIIYYIYDGLL
eukprot:scaffold2183_cov140-Isochrysis_galbana.AAC.5